MVSVQQRLAQNGPQGYGTWPARGRHVSAGRSRGSAGPARTTTAGGLVLAVWVVAVQWPSLGVGFWSWDWYWLDQCAQGRTGWDGPFYDVAHHQNPLPVEVAWYRLALAVLGQHATAQHLLALAGFLLTLAVLYLYLRTLPLPRWAAAGAVTLAGLAPSCQTSWTWFASSPHLWATLLGLSAATAHLAWRRGNSRSWPLILIAGVLLVAGVAMKNDGILGALLILVWEWTTPPRGSHPPGRRRARLTVTVMAAAPVLAFVWWQATAVDPHRDSARTSPDHVLSTIAGLIRFTFLTRSDAELREEFPPGPPAPTFLLWAGAAVGVAILALATLSVREPAGRTLLVAGLGVTGPVATLHPALVGRYVLPLVLAFTGAAGVGAVTAQRLGQRRHVVPHRRRHVLPRRRRHVLPIIVTAITAAAALCWSALAHHNSGSGTTTVREETALLAALQTSRITPTGGPLTLHLVNSPLNPATASFRLLDPTLRPSWRNTPLTVTAPPQPPPANQSTITLTRDATGHYVAAAPIFGVGPLRHARGTDQTEATAGGAVLLAMTSTRIAATWCLTIRSPAALASERKTDHCWLSGGASRAREIASMRAGNCAAVYVDAGRCSNGRPVTTTRPSSPSTVRPTSWRTCTVTGSVSPCGAPTTGRENIVVASARKVSVAQCGRGIRATG